MGSARYDDVPLERLAATGTEDRAPASRGSSDLRQEAAERLAAHRLRRAGGGGPRQATTPESRPQPHNPIAAAVAERFAHSPSYRAVLAEQAQRAIETAAAEAEQAAAEAEIAARNANAVAVAQNKLLAELELWNAPQQFTAATAQTFDGYQAGYQVTPAKPSAAPEKPSAAPEPTISAPYSAQEKAAPHSAPQPIKHSSSAGLTVRLYEDIGPPTRPVAPRQKPTAGSAIAEPEQDAAEALALDEEIAFRQAPVFEPYEIHHTAIAANLLEFPRQLVASRKARPRLAEGPLIEDAPRAPQLRIFEVEPEQIAPAPPAPSTVPDWAGIHLDAQPATAPEEAARLANDTGSEPLPLAPSYVPIQAAPLELRAMSATVDLILVGFAVVIAIGVTTHFTHRALPTGLNAVAVAGGAMSVFWLLYELLFFTLSDQTPGMRYACIAFCTFSDENPARAAIRRRILAQIVAICPLGIGLMWALLDDDGLGWHDRISRIYQRAY